MRDLRKIRDKVEIRLDNRQIAAIFVGSLVLMTIVFYLGVKVGSRLEQVRRVPTPRPEIVHGLYGLTPTPSVGAEIGAPTPGETPGPTPGLTPKIISEQEVNPADLTGEEVGGIRYTFEGTPQPAPGVTPSLTPAATPSPSPTPAPTPAAPTPEPPPPSSCKFTVQVASFTVKEQADEEAARLKSRGWPAYVLRAEIPGKGVYFRVRIGRFQDEQGAQKMRDAIVQAEGKEAFVTRCE